MKLKMPKIAKTGGAAPHGRRPSLHGGHSAFPSGGSRAFSDPSTMAAPDQAFGAAMAMPQGGGAGEAPAASSGSSVEG
jgi:hypothetical protein